MPGHAELARLVSGPEGFLVQQAGLLPEGAFGGEHLQPKLSPGDERRKLLGDVGLDASLRVRPVI